MSWFIRVFSSVTLESWCKHSQAECVMYGNLNHSFQAMVIFGSATNYLLFYLKWELCFVLTGFELLYELNLLSKINVYKSNRTPAIFKPMKHNSNRIFIFFMHKNTQFNVLEYRNVLIVAGNQIYFSFLLWLKMLQTSSIHYLNAVVSYCCIWYTFSTDIITV